MCSLPGGSLARVQTLHMSSEEICALAVENEDTLMPRGHVMERVEFMPFLHFLP